MCYSNGGFHKWGYPKWMVCNGKSHQNGWFWGTPISGNLQISVFQVTCPCRGSCDTPLSCHGNSGSPIRRGWPWSIWRLRRHVPKWLDLQRIAKALQCLFFRTLWKQLIRGVRRWFEGNCRNNSYSRMVKTTIFLCFFFTSSQLQEHSLFRWVSIYGSKLNQANPVACWHPKFRENLGSLLKKEKRHLDSHSGNDTPFQVSFFPPGMDQTLLRKKENSTSCRTTTHRSAR